jgi:hypothetical protein
LKIPLWEIQMSEQVADFLEAQPVAVQERIDMVLTVLSAEGPSLGRPLADSIAGSRIKNLKELRISSSRDSAIRILYCFTKSRIALLLGAGDKSSQWSTWYQDAIEKAEETYERFTKE